MFKAHVNFDLDLRSEKETLFSITKVGLYDIHIASRRCTCVINICQMKISVPLSAELMLLYLSDENINTISYFYLGLNIPH